MNNDLSSDWYDRKSQFMVDALGKEHDKVMHAIFPYAMGGALDLYYFPNGVTGTAVATKELSLLPREGSSNTIYHAYELVMFTRHPVSLDDAKDESTQFGAAHRRINAILNGVAPYSADATLNPNETSEFPEDMDAVGGACLIFDGYTGTPEEAPLDFGLLLIIEIFRSELNYARSNGGANLLAKLMDAGHWPYSDMDREPVV